jgi:hypothetical protein
MFNGPVNNGRPQGVGVPEAQRTQRTSGAGINTLKHFEPTDMFAVQYVGDDGVEHNTVVMRIGSKWYLPPNGEAWSGTLRPLLGESWLGKQLSEAWLTRMASVPKADDVDVFGTDVEKK